MADGVDQIKFWTQYKKLPPDLQEALFDEKTEEYVTRICERRGEGGIIDFVIDKIADLFLGNLPPAEFLKLLTSSLDCNPETAKKIVLEINDALLYPLRESLANLYGREAAMAIAPNASAVIATGAKAPIAAAARPQTIPPAPVPTPTVARPAAAKPAATPTAAPTKPKPMPTAVVSPAMPARKPIPAKPAPVPIRKLPPQAPVRTAAPQDTPTLSAAPSGLRRKVF